MVWFDRAERRSYSDTQPIVGPTRIRGMAKFLLWCILLILCWPLALLALFLYPIVWVLLLPFRLVGIAVGGVFELLRGIVTLPARLITGRSY